MAVTREEKIYREGIEERVGRIESALIIPPGDIGESDQAVCLSGWRYWVEKKLKTLTEKWEPLFNVGNWIDKTEVRLKGLERSETLEKITKEVSEEIRIQGPAFDAEKFREEIEGRLIRIENQKRHLSVENIVNFKKDLKEQRDQWGEHELELFGNGGPGLNRRIKRIEEREKILDRHIWWVRKGVILVLLLCAWSLVAIWRIG